MRYKPTKKFAELTINPNHQNLDRQVYLAFKRDETVECNPPKILIDEGYLEQVLEPVKKVKADHGTSK